MDQNANSLKSIRNGLIAGYSAGMCGIVVGHPLDSIKVLLQTQHSTVSSESPKKNNGSSGAAETAITRASKPTGHGSLSSSTKANVSTAASPRIVSTNQIIGARSLKALYAGMAGPLMASGAVRSLNFAVFDSVRRTLYLNDNRHNAHCVKRRDDYLHYDSLNNVAIASFVSGASTSVFTSPMALIKTKQQIMVWGFRQAVLDTFYRGTALAEGMNAKVLWTGLSNFYIGFGVHFACDAIGTAVYFTSYEWFKRQIASRHNGTQNNNSDGMTPTTTTHNLSLSERMICAASSGMLCWATIFPCDVIRSRLYSQSIYNETNLTALQLIKQIIQKEGLLSLYRGVGVTVARAGPVAAAVLPVYDSVLSWLSRS